MAPLDRGGRIMERLKKQLRFRAVFYFIFSRRPKIESLAPPAARCGSEQLLPERTKARQRGQRTAYRGKGRPTRRPVMMTGMGESISPTGDSGGNPYALAYALVVFAGRKDLNAYGQ